MPETYCGKTCEKCTHRESLNCPGCLNGPGKPVFGDCMIASCCRAQGQKTCETCGKISGCQKLRGAPEAPVRRQWKRVQESEKEAAVIRNAPVLGKWLWLAYWIQFVCLVGSVLLELSVWIPSVYWLGELIRDGAKIATGIMLLQLGMVSDRFKKAGWCILLSGAAYYGMSWCYLFSYGLELILLIAGWVLAFIGEYQELHAYADALRDSDPVRAESWRAMWKWYLGLYIAMGVSLFLMVLIPMVGSLAYEIAYLGTLAVYVIKLVNMYKTAYYFRCMK